MEKLLFIDGCVRGRAKSRTYKVANAFLNAYQALHPDAKLEERCLAAERPACLTGEELERRDALLQTGAFGDPMFAYARQFAQADRIVLAAPYWDLSFPAVVKAYIEQVCVCGICWRYSPEGAEIGLCRAKRLLFVTSSGGVVTPENMPLRGTGEAYLRGLCGMFGIGGADALWAQGLDIVENDAEALLADAVARAKTLAENWRQNREDV